MATGDITIVVTVEGGSAKTATIPSATRITALAWMNRAEAALETDYTDATYSVRLANLAANTIIHAAEKQLITAAAPTTPTYTAAT